MTGNIGFGFHSPRCLFLYFFPPFLYYFHTPICLFLHFFFYSSITFTSLDAYFPPQSSISIYFSLKRPDKNVIHTWRLQNYFVTPSRSTDGKDWKSPPIGKSNGGEMARKQKAKRQMGHKSVQVRQSKLTYRLEMAKCKYVGIKWSSIKNQILFAINKSSLDNLLLVTSVKSS